jgi:Ca2+-binding EF-hand superfamily protein
MNKSMAKNTIFLTHGLLIICLATSSGLASAQSVFARADSDRSGSIDFEEFRGHMSDVFFHADVNHNGSLEGNELSILNQARLSGTDTNNDGALNLREFLNSTASDFRSSDRNRNNLLERNEL